MTSQEIIETVHALDALEAEDAQAETARKIRQAKIAQLRLRLDGLAQPGKRGGGPVDDLTAAISRRKRRSPRQDAIRSLIAKKPNADYRDIVEVLYGAYSKTRVLNARSLVSHMKAAGQIFGEPGAWRLVQPDGSPNKLLHEESEEDDIEEDEVEAA